MRLRVRRHDVEPAVAIQVGDRDAAGHRGGGERLEWTEVAPAVAAPQRHVGAVLIAGDQVGSAVAVHVGNRDVRWSVAHEHLLHRKVILLGAAENERHE